jgi:hypothetical protein
MNPLDLKAKITAIADGPHGSPDMLSVSPVVAIVSAFKGLRTVTDLSEDEVEILRACCDLIAANNWHGSADEAALVSAALPPPPPPPAPPAPPIPAASETEEPIMAAIVGAGIPAAGA